MFFLSPLAKPKRLYSSPKIDTNVYFLYARKSTDEPDRQILSIEAQITELKEYAEREQLVIKEVFIESQTAKEPGRPIFNKMLSLVEKGRANGILAWHADRLARNSVDGGRIIFLLGTHHLSDRIVVHSHAFQLIYNY